MGTYIYEGPGHSIIIAGKPLQRGIPTELDGRAAEEAKAHPDVRAAGKGDAEAGGEAGPAPEHPWGNTVKDALGYVGDDVERAREVLAAEQAKGDEARSSLLTKLETLLAGPGEPGE
jgi:hypothetical protein